MSTPVSNIPHPQLAPHSGNLEQNHTPHPPPSSASLDRSPHLRPLVKSSKFRRHSLPFFVFPPPSQVNASGASLVSSIAEGRPIPLDSNTTADRTSALRELNRDQPSSRHHYTKSSGAPSTVTRTTTGTYSQPVIVRTYSGPPPSSSTSRPASRRVPLSSNASVTSNVSNWRPGRNGTVLSMARHRGSNHKSQGRGGGGSSSSSQADAKLPPIEAFSFKSILADIQQDIGADLDRIAEICARSKYSLSNQYEVHVAPHGPGGSGIRGSASGSTSSRQLHQAVIGGPTLQAITSDDEYSTSSRHRKRRSHGPRRRSAAYGTLETIMSSSGSSEGNKGRSKKSAQERVEDVRGRATRHRRGESQITNGSGSRSGPHDSSSLDTPSLSATERNRLAKKKSASFATAMIDTARYQQHRLQYGQLQAPSAVAVASFLSEPARPETSTRHLEIRTTQEEPSLSFTHEPEPPGEPSWPVVSDSMAASGMIASPDGDDSRGSGSWLNSWMPNWPLREVASSTPRQNGKSKKLRSKSYAEGSLRDLLRSADSSGSGIVDEGAKGGYREGT